MLFYAMFGSAYHLLFKKLQATKVGQPEFGYAPDNNKNCNVMPILHLHAHVATLVQ